MEGMISGCAQVLTLSGISCFTAQNEKNCLVVEYSSSDSIYKALKRMIDDPQLRLRLGKQAKEDAIKHFRYDEKVNLHLELYENYVRKPTHESALFLNSYSCLQSWRITQRQAERNISSNVHFLRSYCGRRWQ
ncbi:MAG: glycosyltransferase [Bacteroidetes bacterium]|nr:glycosyltransferase [Bacteroidota bacterium]